jgi:NTP pyrophosphatase (non-canonical NTP hydrolase)
MEINNYQKQAVQSAFFTSNEHIGEIPYLTIGVAGETGELCEKIKKMFRDGTTDAEDAIERIHAIGKEIGDVMWYLAVLADTLGLQLSDVCQQNIDKCNTRNETGTQHGDGDDRELRTSGNN